MTIRLLGAGRLPSPKAEDGIKAGIASGAVAIALLNVRRERGLEIMAKTPAYDFGWTEPLLAVDIVNRALDDLSQRQGNFLQTDSLLDKPVVPPNPSVRLRCSW
jgi:hypothetical protein